MITELGIAIRDAGLRWVEMNCPKESPANGGKCADAIHKAFNPSNPVRQAYCAEFAWVVVQEACNKLGVTNLLPHTAGAKLMLTRSESALQIDDTPEVGSVFYRFSTSPKNTGHNGVVLDVSNPDYLITAEGNNGDLTAMFKTPWSKVEDARNGWRFIHTELMPPVHPASGAVTGAGMGWLGWALLAGGAYYVYKNR